MISYDKEYNTLLILWDENQPAVSKDIDGEYWLRVSSDGKIVGIEIENFEQFLKKHTPNKGEERDEK